VVVMNGVKGVTANFGVAQNWNQLFPSKNPMPRTGYAMAYDATNRKVMLFGGSDTNGTALGDTWTWDGSTWTKQSPAISPPPRSGAMMAYDAANGTIVLFGGETPSQNIYGVAYYNDTWVWDGAKLTWTKKLTGNSTPSMRSGGGMAYDAARGQVVLFGGSEIEIHFADTWVWDGNVWTQKAPSSSPSARTTQMAYDPLRQRIVLFGGTGMGNFPVFDTWEWDGTNWAVKPAITHPAAAGSALAYNPASQQILFFGSDGATWGWDGTSWVQKMPVTSPPARYTSMVYDGARQQILLFGGVDSSSRRVYSDTWAWLTPNISLVPQASNIAVSGGNYVVNLNLANQGNVPDTTVILSTITLGPASMIGGGFLAGINPGTTGTIPIKFKVSSVGTGVVQLTYQGTYNANGVVGIPFSASTFVFLP